MEITWYLHFVKRWFWLIILLAFVMGSLGYTTSKTSEVKIYQAKTLLSVGNFSSSPDPQAAEIFIGRELVKTYIILATTRDVLQATIDELSLELSVEQVKSMVHPASIPDTSILILTVISTDQVLAADIANELAQQIIEHSPTNLSPEQARQIDLANAQIERLNVELEGLHAQLDQIDQTLAKTTDEAQAAQLTEQRSTLIDQINQATTTIAQYSFTVLELQRRTNTVEVLEHAEIPTVPINTTSNMRVLLGIIIGAALACGIAFVIDSMDNTIHTSAQAVDALKTPVWGVVQKFGRRREKSPACCLITQDQISDEVREAFHTLRTNLMLVDETKQKFFLITSPGPGEGKSQVSANLAIAMAWNGQRVLLVDADLRRPQVHSLLGLPNDFGLTTLLQQPEHEDDPAAIDHLLAQRMLHCIQTTTIPNLVVMSSGPSSSQNPSVLFGSTMMQHWVDVLQSSTSVDVVLFDTPPSLMFADSTVLASVTDAQALLVLDASRTQCRAAQTVKKQFDEVNVPIKGVVLNKANLRDESVYYYYQYQYYYASPGSRLKQRVGGRLLHRLKGHGQQ
jgi:non-specific protein-tyrosine kinase